MNQQNVQMFMRIKK